MRLIVNRFLCLAAIPATLFLAVTSCSKSSSNNNSSNGSLTASTNDTAWTANYAVSGSLTVAASTFEIVGVQIKSGDTTGFLLTFYTPITVNRTFSSDTASLDIQYQVSRTGAVYDGGALAGHSLLTITSYDSTNLRIAGTFSGVLYNVTTGTDSVTVTGGTFSTPFALQ
jgi:hypothetical protein